MGVNMLEHKPNLDELLIEAPAPEKISKENLPEIVKDQVSNITILDEQIQKALAKAGSARDAAQTAYSKSAGLFHKKMQLRVCKLLLKILEMQPQITQKVKNYFLIVYRKWQKLKKLYYPLVVCLLP